MKFRVKYFATMLFISLAAKEAYASSLLDVVNSINARLTQFQLISVALPVLVDKAVVAAYEFRRTGNSDVPVITFRPKNYSFQYNLTQDPTRYSVSDFCEAIHSTKQPNKLNFVEIAAKLGNDREGELARLAKEGPVEIALAAYSAGVSLLEAGYRSQVSLLGTASADPNEPADALYSMPATHQTFGALSQDDGKTLWYRDIERYYAFNGGYFYRDIPNLRSNEFLVKIMGPIMSICREPTTAIRILDGLLISNQKYSDSVRVFIHIYK